MLKHFLISLVMDIPWDRSSLIVPYPLDCEIQWALVASPKDLLIQNSAYPVQVIRINTYKASLLKSF